MVGIDAVAGSLSDRAVAGGMVVERLDPSTRLAVTYLFPKERGLLLLTLLFLQADVQRLGVDGYGQADVAIIRLQSIEVFAQQHSGWSKDTALRYIAIREALQILQRYRHAKHTDLHGPLIPWHPSEQALSAFDALLVEDAARGKLQQLASGVKERFLLLYGPPHSDIRDHLNKRMSPTKRRLLQMRVRNLQTCKTMGEVNL